MNSFITKNFTFQSAAFRGACHRYTGPGVRKHQTQMGRTRSAQRKEAGALNVNSFITNNFTFHPAVFKGAYHKSKDRKMPMA